MTRWVQRLAAAGGVVAAAGLLFAWSGLYNVAASTGHWPVTAWFLHFAMENSVETHAKGDAPRLGDPALVERAAAHFETGCAPCHGSPTERGDLILQKMVPPPPDLSAKIGQWQVEELFWIVRNGIKYAGMPAWPAPVRDDEVWAMTAFLLRLPDISKAEYESLARPARAGGEPDQGTELSDLSGHDAEAQTLVASCARCHGADGRGRASGAFPGIGGQSAAYLGRALAEYAAGQRPSGIMQPVASALQADEIAALATYFSQTETGAALPGSAGEEAGSAGDGAIEQGRRLATHGAPERQVAPCASCHGLEGGPDNPDYPSLAGQFPGFLADQLRLWKTGRRGETVHSAIMAAVIRNITDADIDAAARFYASLGNGRESQQSGIVPEHSD